MPNSSYNPTKVNIGLEQAIQAVLSDRPIAYHAALARALHSVTAGVLLSQLLYWQPRSSNTDGWFWKTGRDISEETALTRTEQENARRILCRVGVLEEKRMGVPARMHFRIDMGKLIELLSGFQAQQQGSGQETPTQEIPAPVQFAGNLQTGLRGTSNLDRGKPANQNAGIPQTITETTAETTPEITSNSNSSISKNYHSKKDGAGETQDAPLAPLRETVMVERPHDGEPARVEGPRRGGMSSVAETIARRREELEQNPPASVPRRGRPPKTTEQIAALIEQWSHELNDSEHVKSNISRAAHLHRDSGLSEDAFVSKLFEARSITKQQGNITKRANSPGGPRNRMPYFFAVVVDLVGLKDDDSPQGSPRQDPSPRSESSVPKIPSNAADYLGGEYGRYLKR